MVDESAVLVIDDVPVTAEPVEEVVEEVTEEVTEEVEEEETRVEFTPEQQAKVDEIARKAAARNLEKLQEAVAARQAAEEQLARLQPAPQQAPGRPFVPPVPDPFEDGYEQKLAFRDEALAKAAQWDTVQAISKYHMAEQQKVQQQAAEEEVKKVVSTYTSRAHKMGIKDAELVFAGSQIQAVGMSGELVEHILHDAQGPAISVYLGNNPEELEKIRAMPAISAAIYLETQIKPKAARTPKKAPPATLDPIRGSGYKEGQLGGKGLVIE